MHLFEAALSWTQVGPREEWLPLVNEIGNLCCGRMIDSRTNALPEFFDDEWMRSNGFLEEEDPLGTVRDLLGAKRQRPIISAQ